MTSTSVLALDERIWRIAAIAQPRTARRFDNRAVNINSSPIATSTGHEIDVQASCGYTGHTPLRTLTPSPTAHSGVQVPRWQAVWAGLRRLRVPLGHALHQKAQRGRWFARPRRCWGGPAPTTQDSHASRRNRAILTKSVSRESEIFMILFRNSRGSSSFPAKVPTRPGCERKAGDHDDR